MVHQIIWLLDPDTEVQARRDVRRLAVAVAKGAANDFALVSVEAWEASSPSLILDSSVPAPSRTAHQVPRVRE